MTSLGQGFITKLDVKWWFLCIHCLLEFSKVNDTEPQDLSDALETEKELENSTINPSSPSITSGTEFYKTTDKIAGNDSKTESVNKSSNLTEEKKDIKVFQMLGKIEFLSSANVKYKFLNSIQIIHSFLRISILYIFRWSSTCV